MAAPTRFLVVLVLAFIFGPAAAHAAAPTNDNFSASVPLPLGPNVQGNTIDATAEPGEPPMPGVNSVEDDCVSISDGSRCSSSVWYTFTVPSTGTYTIETCDLSTEVDTVLAVWTGSSVGALTIETNGVNPVSSDDDCAGGFSENGSQVSFTATSGTTYRVELAGFAAAQGSFYLRAYAGSPHAAVPEPDTFAGKDNSFLDELVGGGPSGSGPRHTASYEFTSDQAGASFQCSFDGSAFAACASPVSLDVTGTHTISIRAVVAGVPDPTPVVETYTIDNSAPDTVITGPPPNPNTTADAAIRSQGSERAYFDTYRCAFDAQDPAIQSCGSHRDFLALCNGTHTFSSAFVDNANNVDPTPATTSFLETGGAATCAAPALGTVTTTSVSATQETINVPFMSAVGAGGRVAVDYGITAAYGQHAEESIFPADTNGGTGLSYLQPGTVYHYKVTVTT